MNPICWRLVDVVSRMLGPDERDAVRGDLAESGETAGQALCGLLGLVVHRQVALWKNWRRWLILVGLIVPLGMLLSIVSTSTANVSAIYAWLYANNWDWALLKKIGFWCVLRNCVTIVFTKCITLVCRSWTAGFALGSVSRGIVRVNGVLFCLMLVLGEFLGAPRYFAYLRQYVQHPAPADPNGPIFALAFYREMFPPIVHAVLVAVPALWGMRQGADAGRFPALLRIVLWAAAIATLTSMVIQEPEFGFFLKAYRRAGLWQGWQMRLLQFVVYWPAGYLVANAIGRRRRGRIAFT